MLLDEQLDWYRLWRRKQRARGDQRIIPELHEIIEQWWVTDEHKRRGSD